MKRTKEFRIIIFILAILIIFNFIALCSISIKMEDVYSAIDVLIKYSIK